MAATAFVAGCSKKTLPKSDLRSVTVEIVASAQKIVGPKSQIAIRPVMQPGKGSASAHLTENIYISPSDPQQSRFLTASLLRIAQRHKFATARRDSTGIIVLDYFSHGVRTHSIHIVMPIPPGHASTAAGSGRAPRLAIILDDLGYDRSSADSLLALPFPLTVSVIPHLPLSSEVAEEAFRRGDQVLLHLPMQSESFEVRHENIELRVGMDSQQVQSTLAGMLETVPHAVGVNNHEGSLATADPALMQELMPALRRRGLFFIDSRTTAATVAYAAAERAGVRAASRKVFLDDTPSEPAVRAQLELAARDATRNGFAIAIGHTHPATIAALAEILPQLEARGVRLVFASDLVR
jgi:polysaccharide deacetylase 2 family uncharacterized protein YibQ